MSSYTHFSFSTSKLPRTSFNDKTVTVTIPDGKGDITSIGYVGLWCVAFSQNFGHVVIPANLNVPPYETESGGGTVTPVEVRHCYFSLWGGMWELK